MSALYTSAALSCRLRDAGLDQVVAGSDHWLLAVPGRSVLVFTPEIRNGGLRRVDVSAVGESNVARALRLDEVLEELTREQEGGALAKRWTMRSSEGAPGAQPFYCSAETGIDLFTFLHVVPQRIAEVTTYGETAAEAAGLALLALLEERHV